MRRAPDADEGCGRHRRREADLLGDRVGARHEGLDLVRGPLGDVEGQPDDVGRSLTATLRRLERTGIVERIVISDRPVAIEYRITRLGKTLRDPVDAILAWVEQHLDEIEQARARFDDEAAT